MRLQDILRSPLASCSARPADFGSKSKSKRKSKEDARGKALSTVGADPYSCAMRTILLIVLILLLIGVLPTWDYSSTWGYRPLGGVGVILLIVIVLALLGKL